MKDKPKTRKLAALLSADAVGYSRLMGDNEDLTVQSLKFCQARVFESAAAHRGRIIDAPGDNILVEFGSVLDAVKCAMDAQRSLAEYNEGLDEARKMRFRMGINIGDVIVEGGKIYGDGVNIAARLESLAEPGGICVSRAVFEQVEAKLNARFESLGEFEVKNIEKPIYAYRLLDLPGSVPGTKRKAPRRRTIRPVSIAASLLLLAAAFGWSFLKTPPLPPKAENTNAHPTIVILPFTNLSDDKEQEYFSNGLSDELISSLSKTTKLSVIASSSAYAYKGSGKSSKQIGQELNADYILEGSVRWNGSRLRIVSKLLESRTGSHIWAEQYDRSFDDLFSLQDEITMNLITALEVELTEGEQARVTGKGTRSLPAYLAVLQARDLKRSQTVESNTKARLFAEDAIRIDPGYAEAYRWLGGTYLIDVWLSNTKNPAETLRKALANAKKAVELNDSLGGAHGLLGNIYIMMKDYEKGIQESELAVKLEPSGADSHAMLGMGLRQSGRSAEAVPHLLKALQLEPRPPEWYFHVLAAAFRDSGDYPQAAKYAEKAVGMNSKNILSRVILCSIYGLQDRWAEAREQASELAKLNPAFSVNNFAATDPQRDTAAKERYVTALKKAGLPD